MVMPQLTQAKELQAAYLCLKDSVADDLLSYSELKHTLQYAGFNPSPAFLAKWWIEEETESINFLEFCQLASEMKPLQEEEVMKIISNIFIINYDKIAVKDLKNLLLMSKRKNIINEYDIDLLIDEVGGENGFVKVSNISKVLCNTISALKKASLAALENKCMDQRLDSRTYTKQQLNLKQQNSSSLMSLTSSMNIEEWFCSSLKGSFFLDKDAIISHQYFLELSASGPTLIKIVQNKFPLLKVEIEPIAFIFRESLSDGSRVYLGCTNMTSGDGINYWVDTLKEGKYVIIPYVSGSHFTIRSHSNEPEMQLVENKGKISLTKNCIDVIKEIFQQMDLDNNGLLNRQEFNLYNWRTSAEIVQDDEWDVVQNNFDVKDGELTLDGFISLHQLEAEDNGGDSEDLWLSLETIGFNRQGQQDQATPYTITVYSQSSQPTLIVSGLKSGGLLLDKALIRSIMEEAEPKAICNLSDLIKYQLIGEKRGAIAIQNKSNSKFKLIIDCSASTNAATNRPDLCWEIILDKKSAIVAHQLSPANPNNPWKVICHETLIELEE